MCSIAGIYNFSEDSNIDKIVLENMSLNLKHRGPDGSGQYIDHNIGLAHNRLSIIDINSRADQPFQKQDKILLFNGLIFNYKELRTDLKSLGYQFTTASDTEVVLAAYDCWGPACQNKFNGMWAIAIYDLKEKSLFLSRDRYGIKPLYFTRVKDQFYFASEVKAFRAISSFKYQLNTPYFSEYISTGALEYDENTLFCNIHQIKPGHSLKLNFNEKTIGKQKIYYTISTNEVSRTYSSLKSTFKSYFKKAVDKRLVADVSVGISLSGGIDSNAILSSIPQNHLHNISSFSSYDDSDSKSESAVIKKSVAHYKIENHSIAPDKDEYFTTLSDLIFTQEVPFFSTSIYAQNQVFKLTKKKKFPVSLSGQGADEMLMGYETFVKKQILANPIRFLFSPSKWFYLKKKRRKTIQAQDFIHSDFCNRQTLNEPHSQKDLALHLFTKKVLPSLLHFEDRNSMSYGVESRLPFLDHELVDFVFTINEKHLLGNYERKKLLKESMVNEIPGFILNNKMKSAYYTPSLEWLSNPPKNFLDKHRSILTKHKRFFKSTIEIDKAEKPLVVKMIIIALWLEFFEVEY